jgi:hypothetical protein
MLRALRFLNQYIMAVVARQTRMKTKMAAKMMVPVVHGFLEVGVSVGLGFG